MIRQDAECREQEAYDAGRLAGYEEGLDAARPVFADIATALHEHECRVYGLAMHDAGEPGSACRDAADRLEQAGYGFVDRFRT